MTYLVGASLILLNTIVRLVAAHETEDVGDTEVAIEEVVMQEDETDEGILGRVFATCSDVIWKHLYVNEMHGEGASSGFLRYIDYDPAHDPAGAEHAYFGRNGRVLCDVALAFAMRGLFSFCVFRIVGKGTNRLVACAATGVVLVFPSEWMLFVVLCFMCFVWSAHCAAFREYHEHSVNISKVYALAIPTQAAMAVPLIVLYKLWFFCVAMLPSSVVLWLFPDYEGNDALFDSGETTTWTSRILTVLYPSFLRVLDDDDTPMLWAWLKFQVAVVYVILGAWFCSSTMMVNEMRTGTSTFNTYNYLGQRREKKQRRRKRWNRFCLLTVVCLIATRAAPLHFGMLTIAGVVFALVGALSPRIFGIVEAIRRATTKKKRKSSDDDEGASKKEDDDSKEKDDKSKDDTSPAPAVWEWLDSATWKAYDPLTKALIEQRWSLWFKLAEKAGKFKTTTFQSGNSDTTFNMKIVIASRQYEISLDKHGNGSQKNMQTNFSRKVRRRELNGGGPIAPAAPKAADAAATIAQSIVASRMLSWTHDTLDGMPPKAVRFGILALILVFPLVFGFHFIKVLFFVVPPFLLQFWPIAYVWSWFQYAWSLVKGYTRTEVQLWRDFFGIPNTLGYWNIVLQGIALRIGSMIVYMSTYVGSGGPTFEVVCHVLFIIFAPSILSLFGMLFLLARRPPFSKATRSALHKAWYIVLPLTVLLRLQMRAVGRLNEDDSESPNLFSVCGFWAPEACYDDDDAMLLKVQRVRSDFLFDTSPPGMYFSKWLFDLVMGADDSYPETTISNQTYVFSFESQILFLTATYGGTMAHVMQHQRSVDGGSLLIFTLCVACASVVFPLACSAIGLVGPMLALVVWTADSIYRDFRAAVRDSARKAYELKRQKSKTNPKKIRLARQISVPNDWDDFKVTTQSTTQKPELVKLPHTHKDAARIISEYKKSGGKGTVQDVFQVRNTELWFKYATTRSQMPSSAVEKWVWHGANRMGAEGIVGLGPKSGGGFDWRFCGQHGTVYGKGAYFAFNASYSCSSTYSPRDPTDGLHRIFYARVCVDDADVVQGSSRLNTPPGKYTVAVDNLSNPNMYVVFDVTQSYPAYLLTWK